ncbi:MAG: thioredoxin family protein [Planctomycetaceae bacterium]|jgi:YHS domain-containing protein/thioredoxin-related protein|nr:thioredoxin family protein [Planctomycetaceae bacterium]
MKIISLGSLFYKIGILFAVLFFCFAANTKAEAQQEIIWETNFERAVARAKTLNRPLFLHFYGDNCPPCKLMESNVFKNGQVISQMNRFFVPMKIKVSEQTQLAKRFSVQVIPTDLVLTGESRLIHRRQGGITTERFLEYLHFLLSNINQPSHQEITQQVSPPIQTVPEPVNSAPPISPLQIEQQQQQQQQLLSPQTAPMALSSQPSEINNKAEQPKIEITQTELPKTEQPLRDPFTRQPVAPPLPVQAGQTPTESINPIRVTEKRTTPEEKHVLPKTVDAVLVPQIQIHKEPATVTVSPMGLQNNIDETTTSSTSTTMVEVPLGLEGYCPVLLSTEERWIPGNPAYYTMYRGHVFRFSSEEAMIEFMKAPALYAPVAMGEDIVLMVDRNKKVYGNRKYGAWFQGRVFLFSSQESLDSFAARPEYYAEIAIKYETALKGSSGRFF